MYGYEYDYDRKDYYEDKHDKHDKFKKVKCYCEEQEDRRKHEDKCDRKHDDKKEHDDEKKKFVIKGYLYFKEDDHDCDRKKRY
ncbi:hypothetical protein ACU3L3_15630 [Priestia endophytica]|jgi:hypothetical protein|uniref:Spore coat protein C n=1 Tax=Priestia endophytica DSM 13796 TaxID=1121089 RepID=A0A1I6B7R3_9BACI|nr:hypothetical protein [Priestia endophytica]KYG26706.1 hypothetical protein AZF06_15270 [Priestia endophytica]MBG9813047.1 hypothetical protein [Priestia endophytica]MCM3538499.1 hypothetical protein [Priestia endophytica]RAS76609.1 hypothetical protein A4U60_19025 [Priestia endophytica]RAS85836.1 hypothetical protein A3863_18635 [Priestia endophytica]